MAGTIVSDTLQDGSGNSTATTNAIKGSAKAWVYFNGSGGITINASYNISSVVRNSTGDYTVNFSTAMPSANYAVCAMPGSGGTVTGVIGTSSQTTSSYRFIYANTTGGTSDSSIAGIAVFS